MPQDDLVRRARALKVLGVLVVVPCLFLAMAAGSHARNTGATDSLVLAIVLGLGGPLVLLLCFNGARRMVAGKPNRLEERGYVPALIAGAMFASTYQRDLLWFVVITAVAAAGLYVAAMEAEHVIYNSGGRVTHSRRRGLVMGLVLVAFACLSVVYAMGPFLIIEAGAGNWVIGGRYHAATGPGLLATTIYLGATEYWLTRIVVRSSPWSRIGSQPWTRFLSLLAVIVGLKLAGYLVPRAVGVDSALTPPPYIRAQFANAYFLLIGGYVAGTVLVIKKLWSDAASY